jgi:hypothetical protein
MKNWLRRPRGALGMGLTAALAGGAAGAIINLVFVVRTGRRPDPPFPILLGVFGFIAGVLFSGLLRLGRGGRRPEHRSRRDGP